jgi:hypothetical protein
LYNCTWINCVIDGARDKVDTYCAYPQSAKSDLSSSF